MLAHENDQEFWSSIKSLVASSELKYKEGDYKGAIEDRRKVKRIMLDVPDQNQLEKKFKSLIKTTMANNSKYDLIKDYKTKLNELRKDEIASDLEKLSELKYQSGDFKGSIKAIRRAEKYY